MADLKSKLRTASKKVAYAQPVREAVRRVAALEKPATLDKIISHSPLAQTLRSIESESLPAGKTYIRLRIEDWQPILGESFRFYYRDELLYGNVVEQPEKAYPLEYRNIVGPSTDPSDYSVRLVSGKRAGESLDFEVAFRREPLPPKNRSCTTSALRSASTVGRTMRCEETLRTRRKSSSLSQGWVCRWEESSIRCRL